MEVQAEELELLRRDLAGLRVPTNPETLKSRLERCRAHMQSCQTSKSNIEAQISEETIRLRRMEHDLRQYTLKPRRNDYLQTRIDKVIHFHERISRQQHILIVLGERLQEASRRLDAANESTCQAQQRAEAAQAQSPKKPGPESSENA